MKSSRNLKASLSFILLLFIPYIVYGKEKRTIDTFNSQPFNVLLEAPQKKLILRSTFKSKEFLDNENFNFTLEKRAREVLNYFSELPFIKCNENNLGFHLCNRKTVKQATDRSISRILMGKDIGLFKLLIDHNKFYRFGQYGSTTNFCNPIRRGDYDFATINYSMLLHTALLIEKKEGSNIFSDEQKRKIIFEILPIEGGDFYSRFDCNLKGPIGRVNLIDTENHVLMVNASRYLNNSLIANCDKFMNQDLCPEWYKDKKFDNEESGFKSKLSRLLIQYLKNHFEEYNSKPYQVYTTKALTLLATHSPDHEIRKLAAMNLDYLSLLMRFQGHDLRRVGPFRRQPVYKNSTTMLEGDRELERYVVLLGKFNGNEIELPYDSSLITTASAFLKIAYNNGYVIHPFLRRMWRNKRKIIWHGYHIHGNIEIFTLFEKVLIVSGGRYKPHLPPALDWYGTLPVLGSLFGRFIHSQSLNKQDAWASPSVILDLGYNATNYSDYLHFKGHKKYTRKNNSCLYKSLICGIGLHIPERYNFEKRDKLDDWQFFHNKKSSIFLALWSKKCDQEYCHNFPSNHNNFGFVYLESDKQDFDKFKAKFLSQRIKLIAPNKYEYIYSDDEKLLVEINQKTGKTIVSQVNKRNYLEKYADKGTVMRGNVISKSNTTLIVDDFEVDEMLPNKFLMTFESEKKFGIKIFNDRIGNRDFDN